LYHTAPEDGTATHRCGRRQLHALVRLRTTSHSSDPFLAGSTGGTHRPLPWTAIVMPDGPLLGAHQLRRAPRATGLSVG